MLNWGRFSYICYKLWASYEISDRSKYCIEHTIFIYLDNWILIRDRKTIKMADGDVTHTGMARRKTTTSPAEPESPGLAPWLGPHAAYLAPYYPYGDFLHTYHYVRDTTGELVTNFDDTNTSSQIVLGPTNQRRTMQCYFYCQLAFAHFYV